MPIKTILVHLDTEVHAAALLRQAVRLAKAHEAHLIGLHVVPDVFVPAVVPVEVTGELIEAQRQASEAAATRIGAIFAEGLAGSGVPNEWRRIEARYEAAGEVVMLHGRSADLVVLGQPDKALDPFEGIAVAEEVMLGVGRPVLVVPNKTAVEATGRRVLIGWNDSREAARAAFDALPFLARAESVEIVAAEPRRSWLGGEPSQRPAPGSGIAAALGRLGVACRVVTSKPDVADVAGALIARAEAEGCDLIVMGGYGHSRLREVVFGGATRGMMDRMTVPVLMSH